MAETALSPDPDLVGALRALANPMRLQLLSWLREPERHFSLEGAIADPVEVGLCVSHIQAKVRDLGTIVDKLHTHVEAGADHVGVQVIGIDPGRPVMPYWRMLGDALLSPGQR
jgi:DNA-binding transcriptional ArsR family regulator